MSIYANIGQATGSRGGNYLTPGKYIVLVKRAFDKDSSKNRDKFFIAELQVVSSEKTDEKLDPKYPGSDCSWAVKMNGEYPDLSLGNVADFMRAGMASLADANGEERPSDIDQVDIDEEVAAAITGEDNLLAGVYLMADAFNIKTKKGTDFTRVTWGVPSADAIQKALAA